MGKHIIISDDGFPLNKEILRFLQQTYSEPLVHLANLCGQAVVISGFEVLSENATERVYSSGVLVYQGEIYHFENSTHFYTNASNALSIIEQTGQRQYDNVSGSILPVTKNRFMQFANNNATGVVVQIDASSFVRLKTIQELSQFQLPAGIVIDPNYIAFTQVLLNKLNGIQPNAQVNIKPDWNAQPSAANGILNRPNGLMVVYDSNSYHFGDVAGVIERTININSPTANYDVLPSFFDASSGGASVLWSLTEMHQNYFKIRIRESGNLAQNMTMSYYIVAKI